MRGRPGLKNNQTLLFKGRRNFISHTEVGTFRVIFLNNLHPVQDNLSADELRHWDWTTKESDRTGQNFVVCHVLPRILVVNVFQHVHEKTGTIDHFLGAVDWPVTAGDDQFEGLRVVRLLEAPSGLGLVNSEVSAE